MAEFVDKTGQKYGKLTVLGLSNTKTKTGHLRWQCQCECGSVCIIAGSDLSTGRTKSCGCIRKNATRERAMKHGKSRHYRLYQTWQNMKKRCLNSKNPEYRNYGGRGITICSEWVGSFETFEAWALKNGYKNNLTIDRINVDGNYCPDNCQWLTRSENSKKAHMDRRRKNGTVY